MKNMLFKLWKSVDPGVAVPISVTLLLISVVSIEILYLILEEGDALGWIHEGQFWHVEHLTFFACVLLNILGNLVMFKKRNASIQGVFLSGVSVGQGWTLTDESPTSPPGQVSSSAFVFAFVADTCVFGFLLVSGFLLIHIILLFGGQTKKEWFNSQFSYDLGWHRNIKELLGKRWYLVWLFPLVSSPLPGDGIDFEMKQVIHSPPKIF
ncbi:probable palmitoyltransferase ZDHHC24 [Protopterus annectens]|uniref:probable palmitoyltransferase ZDHHC24 n=1 Tax=Protopterus annectens TaxID=7888 RepID=UPI001CFADBF1|nr:probable palmitoyltransferase ZDHHC24 [Protopterus annectens]